MLSYNWQWYSLINVDEWHLTCNKLTAINEGLFKRKYDYTFTETFQLNNNIPSYV